MWALVTRLLLLTSLVAARGSKVTHSAAFVAEFYAQKHIRQVVTFACWEDNDAFQYYRQLTNAQTKTSYIGIQAKLNLNSILKVNYYKLGIVLDMDCPGSYDIFNQFASVSGLPFNDSYVWLAITSAEEVPRAALAQLPLTVESEFTLALLQKSGSLALYDAYNHGYRHGGKLNVTSMGRWDEAAGLANYLTQYKYKRRQDFHGLTLNFSIALTTEPKPDLETYLTQPINPHLDTMNRFHYNVVLQLREFYNFKMNLALTNSWGYKINGTFNGILGGMVRGEVDISASPLYYKEERVPVCEWTVETFVVRACFIFRHPKKNALRNPFLKPFTQNVWIVSLQVGMACWLLLLLIFKLENTHSLSKAHKLYENPSSDTAIIAIAAVSQQGSSEEPHLYSGRIVYITLFLWALMMYQFYSADIVGSLIAAPPRFIKTRRDLIHSNLHLAYEEVPYMHDYFRTTNDPTSLDVIEKKFKRSGKRKFYTNAQDGLSQVRRGGYAFLIDTATAYKIIEDTFSQEEICDLAEIALTGPKYVGIVTSKHSPFKKMVMYGLRKIVEHGLVNRLNRKWETGQPSCPKSFQSKPMPVEIQEASSALFLVAGGLVFASLLVAAELQLSGAHRRLAPAASRVSSATAATLERGQVTSADEHASPQPSLSPPLSS